MHVQGPAPGSGRLKGDARTRVTALLQWENKKEIKNKQKRTWVSMQLQTANVLNMSAYNLWNCDYFDVFVCILCYNFWGFFVPTELILPLLLFASGVSAFLSGLFGWFIIFGFVIALITYVCYKRFDIYD